MSLMPSPVLLAWTSAWNTAGFPRDIPRTLMSELLKVTYCHIVIEVHDVLMLHGK